ncbi:MAG: HAD family hydrolase [bacterium]
MKAILFDFGGTLIDQEIFLSRARDEAIEAIRRMYNRGDSLPRMRDLYDKIGGEVWRKYRDTDPRMKEKAARYEILSRLIEAIGETPAQEDVERAYRALVVGAIESDSLYPQTREVLERLQGRYKMAIVSNGLADYTWGFLERKCIANFFPVKLISEVELNKFQGVQISVPSTFNIQGTLYNKTALGKAGIIAPTKSIEEAWTWKEFAQNMAKAQEAAKSKQAFVFWMHTSNCRLFPVYAAGGSIFSEDFQTNNLDNPETLEALEFMVDCAQKGLVPSDNMNPTVDWVTQFVSGNFVGWIGHGNWGVAQMKEIVKNFEWDFTFLPRWKRHSVPNQGDGWIIFKLSKNKQWGAKFIELMKDSFKKPIFTYHVYGSEFSGRARHS